MTSRPHETAARTRSLRTLACLAAWTLLAGCYELKRYNGARDATVDLTLIDVTPDRRDVPVDRDVTRPDATPDVVDAADVAPDTRCPEGEERCDGVCVDTRVDRTHCGRCDNVCDAPENGAATCAASDCAFTCDEGYHACGAVCADDDALSTCGDRCEACPSRANAESACTDGACVFACIAGFADCDGMADNGCETSLETAEHCGRCELRCAEPTPLCRVSAGTTGCVSGCAATATRCGMACVETATDTSNCGACGRACLAPAGGRSACVAGSCTRACPTGQHECDGRCTPDAAVASCGARCAPCATVANASATCAMGACGFVCDDPFEDCDRMSANGCEVNLNTSAASCGRCGNACSAPTNATPTCASGRCGFACRMGFGDCDANPMNGCETVVPSFIIGCGACGSMGCDDMNPCTDDACVPATGCTHTPNAARCDDGNACTTGDVCAAGRCTAGTARNCDDTNPCTDDTCAPSTGACAHDNRTGSCDDGDSCTTDDTCTDGVCGGTPGECG